MGVGMSRCDAWLKCRLKALESTYHKLWDMRPMFYNGLEELPFRDMRIDRMEFCCYSFEE